MLCSETCPRGLKNCKPLSNIVSTLENGDPDPQCSIVCMGLHNEKHKDFPDDRFRHCFRSHPDAGSDRMNDYDLYDIQSVVSVLSVSALIDQHIPDLK